MSQFVKLPPITKPRTGCGSFGTTPIFASLESYICGSATAGIMKGDNLAFDYQRMESELPSDDPRFILKFWEAEAVKDPDHDWRCFYGNALDENEYQRQAPGEWVLVKQGLGYAGGEEF